MSIVWTNAYILSYLGLNRLGCFEANKDRIVEKGILPLYLELIQKPCNDDERLIAVQGLWIFSYSDKARNLILNDTEVLAGMTSASSFGWLILVKWLSACFMKRRERMFWDIIGN